MNNYRAERRTDKRAKVSNKQCAMCGVSIDLRKTYCSACSDIRVERRIKRHRRAQTKTRKGA